VTLGVCYEQVPRFGGGVYHPILRRLETLTDEPLRTAIKNHDKRANMELDLEEKVAGVVKKQKDRGFGQSTPALICGGAYQPDAIGSIRASSRRGSQNNAGAGGKLQC
jgi:hypothetical protein